LGCCPGKSIFWQFADSDAWYLQSAALTCKASGANNPQDLLVRLLLDNEEELKKVDVIQYRH
jgi:hypothetical protein